MKLHADAAVVMEGATYDCTVAQFGSATFEITIERDGEPSHQLYTPPGTPHPIIVASEVIRRLCDLNKRLETEYVEDIGYASYFIGSVNSGQFYNQHPNKAVLIGVRRYSPHTKFEAVENELRTELDQMAEQHKVRIHLDLKKVRDGYRIDKNDFAVTTLQDAVREVRKINLPLAGKRLVTDAGIIVNHLGIPTICYGPDQQTAHGDVEYVEISELELTVKVYLKFIMDFMSFDRKDTIR
jgi:succinyl-diaminopimelate desuccinylase